MPKIFLLKNRLQEQQLKLLQAQKNGKLLGSDDVNNADTNCSGSHNSSETLTPPRSPLSDCQPLSLTVNKTTGENNHDSHEKYERPLTPESNKSISPTSTEIESPTGDNHFRRLLSPAVKRETPGSNTTTPHRTLTLAERKQYDPVVYDYHKLNIRCHEVPESHKPPVPPVTTNNRTIQSEAHNLKVQVKFESKHLKEIEPEKKTVVKCQQVSVIQRTPTTPPKEPLIPVVYPTPSRELEPIQEAPIDYHIPKAQSPSLSPPSNIEKSSTSPPQGSNPHPSSYQPSKDFFHKPMDSSSPDQGYSSPGMGSVRNFYDSGQGNQPDPVPMDSGGGGSQDYEDARSPKHYQMLQNVSTSFPNSNGNGFQIPNGDGNMILQPNGGGTQMELCKIESLNQRLSPFGNCLPSLHSIPGIPVYQQRYPEPPAYILPNEVDTPPDPVMESSQSSALHFSSSSLLDQVQPMMVDSSSSPVDLFTPNHSPESGIFCQMPHEPPPILAPMEPPVKPLPENCFPKHFETSRDYQTPAQFNKPVLHENRTVDFKSTPDNVSHYTKCVTPENQTSIYAKLTLSENNVTDYTKTCIPENSTPIHNKAVISEQNHPYVKPIIPEQNNSPYTKTAAPEQTLSPYKSLIPEQNNSQYTKPIVPEQTLSPYKSLIPEQNNISYTKPVVPEQALSPYKTIIREQNASQYTKSVNSEHNSTQYTKSVIPNSNTFHYTKSILPENNSVTVTSTTQFPLSPSKILPDSPGLSLSPGSQKQYDYESPGQHEQSVVPILESFDEDFSVSTLTESTSPQKSAPARRTSTSSNVSTSSNSATPGDISNIPNLSVRISILQQRLGLPGSAHIEFVNGGHGIKNPMIPADATVTQTEKLPPVICEEDPSKFACRICSKVFSLQRLLNRHMKCHSDVKRYLCTFCGKGFNDTFDLKRHTRTHTGVRPYKCDLCEKSFTQRCSLESHCLKVHGVSHQYAHKQRRIKMYVCEECGHTTNEPEVHYLHLKNTHPYSPALLKFYDKRHFKFTNSNFASMLLQVRS